jgi:predicted anti-sigma-YlaC factor YlaD
MRRDMGNHLSEEALNDVLIGMGPVEAEAHLARCRECRAQVEEFAGDVKLFNASTMAWSEARSVREAQAGRAVMARPAPVRRMPFALAGSAAASILAIMVALSVGHREGWFAPPSNTNHAVAIPDMQAQIAQDNALMEAVSAAISPQEESPIDEYGLSDRHSKHGKARPR